MEQVQINVYKFDELSDEAKEKAIQSQLDEPFWGSDEAIASLEAFVDYFGYSLDNWQIDFLEPQRNDYKLSKFYAYDEADIDDLLEKAGSYDNNTLKGRGDCVLTGVCYDENLLDGFRKEWKGGNKDVEECIQFGIQEWGWALQTECEYQFSEEGYSETCEANDYKFCEDGSLFS